EHVDVESLADAEGGDVSHGCLRVEPLTASLAAPLLCRRRRHRTAPARRKSSAGRGAGMLRRRSTPPAGQSRVSRHARWMRALRSKSGGMVEALISSQWANCETASSSRRNRRKLLEKYSAPPWASRATAAR